MTNDTVIMPAHLHSHLLLPQHTGKPDKSKRECKPTHGVSSFIGIRLKRQIKDKKERMYNCKIRANWDSVLRCQEINKFKSITS